MSEKEKTEVNLRQFKGHHRKFPWALIIRFLVMGISIGLIFFMVKFVADLQEKKVVPVNKDDIEIEWNP